jgi:3-phenylpropionate/trans-cinnamate dioxygenase ferredoxin reductase component
LKATRIDRIVVVGGGVAAQRCAWKLRALGFAGLLTVVGGEENPPYDRTMVSKDLLRGEASVEDVMLRPPSAYADAGIELRLGTLAAELDPGGARVVLTSGEALPYDRLVVCTGGAPVLPGRLRHPRVLVVRDAADADALRDQLLAGGPVAVIGGGVLGGEVASAARAMGLDVTVVEATAEPLAAVLGAEVGARVRALHESNGITMLTSSAVASIDDGNAGALRVRITGGRELTAQTVVVAVGMRPAVDWLATSGIAVDGGIVTTAYCRSNLPGVLAAGDCARWRNLRYDVSMRVEHWHTAARHGEAAAASALDAGEPFAPVPFWWTDVHGMKLQFAGHCVGWDEVELDDGIPGHGFVAHYRRAGEVVAVAAAGQPRAVAATRRQLESNVIEGSLVA